MFARHFPDPLTRGPVRGPAEEESQDSFTTCDGRRGVKGQTRFKLLHRCVTVMFDVQMKPLPVMM